MIKGITGFLLILLIGACSNSINLEQMLKNENVFILTIHTINKEGSTYSTEIDTIYKDSEKISKLKFWLTDNSANWENSIASYAMSDMSLIGNDFRFLVYKTGVVIGFTDSSGKQKQFTKKIDKSVFNFLVEN